MMGSTAKLDAGVQRCIDDHLDLIEETLRGPGMSRGERQSILDDVQTQILDMLAARTEGNPTVEDVRAVIAELDPPESYATGDDVLTEQPVPPPQAGSEPHFSKLAIAGAFWSPFLLVFLPLSVLYARPVIVEPGTLPPGPAWWQYALMFTILPLGLTAPFGTTILGMIAISRIRHSAGRLYGLGLAVTDALMYPVIALFFASYGLAVLIGAFLEAPGEIFDLTDPHSWSDLMSNGLIWTLAIAIWLVTSGLLIWWTWRAASRPVDKA